MSALLPRHRLIERHRLFEFTRPVPPSSSVCIRLPAPAGSTRLALGKIRSWRRGIGPTSVAPTTAVDVERCRSGLAAPCRLLQSLTATLVFACTHSTTTAGVEGLSPQGWKPGPNISAAARSAAITASTGTAKSIRIRLITPRSRLSVHAGLP